VKTELANVNAAAGKRHITVKHGELKADTIALDAIKDKMTCYVILSLLLSDFSNFENM